MKRFYLLTGAIFSFVYLAIGMLVLTGKFTFGIESRNFQIGFGAAIMAYGVFRLYMFYWNLRNSGNDENN
jgi:hypothetical protein